MQKINQLLPSRAQVIIHLRRRLGIVIYSCMFMIILWVSWVIFNNVYRVSINPTPIAATEIVARRQKVNITDFNSTLVNIEKKRSVSRQEILSIPNLFR